MDLTQSRSADILVVRAGGQLNVANRHELKDLVQVALDGGERKFVLDFSGTGYIDSSGLGALVTLVKKVRESGGDIRLAGLNADLRQLFTLTKLDSLFRIADTPDEALAAF